MAGQSDEIWYLIGLKERKGSSVRRGIRSPSFVSVSVRVSLSSSPLPAFRPPPSTVTSMVYRASVTARMPGWLPRFHMTSLPSPPRCCSLARLARASRVA